MMVAVNSGRSFEVHRFWPVACIVVSALLMFPVSSQAAALSVKRAKLAAERAGERLPVEANVDVGSCERRSSRRIHCKVSKERQTGATVGLTYQIATGVVAVVQRGRRVRARLMRVTVHHFCTSQPFSDVVGGVPGNPPTAPPPPSEESPCPASAA
jgi:hypothetical protein